MTRKELIAFLDLAKRFRETLLMDDDFPLMRDRFDFALDEMRRKVVGEFPKIVCLCGSTRFKDAFVQAQKDETLAGRIVLTVGTFGHQEGLDMGGDVKKRLDELHLRKIDLADEVLILNVKAWNCSQCGHWYFGHEDYEGCECTDEHLHQRPYIGESTRRELEYATRKGKVVRFLETP